MSEQPPIPTTPQDSEPGPLETAGDQPIEAEPAAIQPDAPEPQPIVPEKPARPARRRTWLFGMLIVLAVLLAAGGGFAYLRLTEVNLLEQAQVDLASGNWQAVEAGCSRLLGLPANLLVEPQRCLPLRGEAYFKLGELDKAQVDLHSAQAQYPDQARLYLISAEIYLQQNQPDQALAAAAETAKRDPALIRAHLIMTQIYLDQGKNDLALAAANEAQELDDTLALPYTLQALDAYQRGQLKDAEQAAQSALQRDPQQAAAARVLGSIQAWRGEFSAALGTLNQVLALDPKDIQALASRAALHYFQDQFGDFKTDAETVLALDTTSAGALMVQALQADLAHERQKAYDLIDQTVQLDGSRAEYYYLRAWLYPTTEKENKSILADLAKALELNPHLYLAQWLNLSTRWSMYEEIDLASEADRLLAAVPESGLGHSLMVMHFTRRMELNQALDWANRYVKAQPALSNTYLTRARVYEKQDEFEKSKADLEKALEINPDSISARLGLILIQSELKKPDEAMKLADEAVQQHPNLPEFYSERAYLHVQNKDLDLARKDLEQALELDPLNLDALAYRVLLDIGDKDYTKATGDITRISEVSPKTPDAYILRAMTYQAQEDPKRALEEIKQAIEIDPYNPYTQDIAAQASLDLLEYDQALGYANAAIKLSPKDDDAWSLVAKAYFDKKDYSQAVSAANKTLEFSPERVGMYTLLSDAYLAQGDYARAADSLQKALDLDNQLTLDQVQLLEKAIAFYHSVPPLINGLRTVNNTLHGFSLSYSAEWVPMSNELSTIYLTLASKTSRDIRVVVTAQTVDDPNAYLYTTQMFADYMSALFTKSGFTFGDRSYITGDQPGIVDTFTATGEIWSDSDKKQLLMGKIYYFYIPGRLVLLQFTTTPALFENYANKVDEIVKSLKVIK